MVTRLELARRVRDVCRLGRSDRAVTAELRVLGARVDAALCVIDRGEGGGEALACDGIAVRALLTREDLAGA